MYYLVTLMLFQTCMTCILSSVLFLLTKTIRNNFSYLKLAEIKYKYSIENFKNIKNIYKCCLSNDLKFRLSTKINKTEIEIIINES